MIRQILLVIFAFVSSNVNAQQCFTNKQTNWNEVEIQNDSLILEFIEQSNSEYKFADLYEKFPQNFHIIDYNLDGKIEIVYSGVGFGEGYYTFIYEKQKDSTFVSVFEKAGLIVDVSKMNAVSPISFVLQLRGWGADNIIIYESYNCILSGDNYILTPSLKYEGVVNISLPDRYFENPVFFKVSNDRYKIRQTPLIDDDSENYDLYSKGNCIGVYNKGAEGYALGESIDDTGRKWWYVIMYNKPGDLGKPSFGSGFPYYSFGWMSSRYLEKINHLKNH